MSEENIEENTTEQENVEEIVEEKPLEEKIAELGDDGEPKEEEEASEEPVEGDEEPKEAESAYEPNLKYKVNGKEFDLDPRVHDLIKSEDDEKFFKDLFEKHDGYESKAEKLDQYRDDYTQLAQTVNGVLDARDSGDYKAMFEALQIQNMPLTDLLEARGITKQEIIQHAYNLATLTEEQEMAYNTQRDLELKNRKLESQQDQFLSDYSAQRQQAAQSQLDMALSQPMIKPLAEEFDAKHGENAFWNEVVNRGLAYHAQNGKDADIGWLVKDTVSKFGLGQGQASQASPQPKTDNLTQDNKLKVIPNTGTSSRAPAKRKIKSIEDIEAAYKEYTS